MTSSTLAVLLILPASLGSGTGLIQGSGQAQSQTPQAERMRIDVESLGPQVGERVPDFNLSDQTGKARTLQSIMGPNGAMLVFVRSADW